MWSVRGCLSATSSHYQLVRRGGGNIGEIIKRGKLEVVHFAITKPNATARMPKTTLPRAYRQKTV